MQLSDLISQFRLDTADPELPGSGDDSDSLWSDAEITEYLNDALNEFYVEVPFQLDSSNSTALYQLNVTADTEWVPIDERILEVRRAKLQSNDSYLDVLNWKDLQSMDTTFDYFSTFNRAGWEDSTGSPRVLLLDMQSYQARTYPISTTSDTIDLTVVHTVPSELSASGDEPAIPERFHRKLLIYAYYRAYKKQDAETFNINMSREFYAEWLNELIKARRQYRRLMNRVPLTVKTNTDYC